MLHRGKFVVIGCTILIAVAAACNGSSKSSEPTSSAGSGDTAATAAPDATPTTEAGTTVTSDDGKVSLFVPDGAIPAGTNVTVAAMPHDQLPAELREVVGSAGGYRLEPDRLVFGKPATATLTIDRSELDDPEGTQAAYALVSFNQSNGREVLDSETHASSDGSTVTVTAQISHFSWITRTKGSLEVGLRRMPREQAVGATFEPPVTVRKLNEQVTLAPVDAEMLISGVLEFVSDKDTAIHLDLYSGSDGISYFYPQYRCPRPGIGSYGTHVTAVSTVNGLPDQHTRLAVTLDSTVECKTGAVPTEEGPSPTVATSTREVHVVQTLGCEHTQPGVRSELRKKGRITDRSGGPVKGVRITETATGPGLEDRDGPASEVDGFGVTDANGEFTITWTIKKFGPYGVKVTDVTLPDGTPAALDETSTTTVSYTVDRVCTAP